MSFIKKIFAKEGNDLVKEGSILIWSLFMLIIIFAFSGLFISYVNMTDNLTLADQTVETIGKTRVQAIDVPMKEQYGHIEILHCKGNTRLVGTHKDCTYDDKYINYFSSLADSDDYDGYNYAPNDSGVRSSTTGANAEVTPGYDRPIRSQIDNFYIQAVEYADRSAKLTGIESLKNRIKHFDEDAGSNTDAFLAAEQDNFCIEVFPLPPGNTLEFPEISCDVEIQTQSGTETVTIEAKDVEVNGIDHALSKNISADIENKRLKVYNAVFVGFAYEDTNSMFYSFFSNMFPNIDPPIRKVHRIVYPQIDTDSFESSGW